MLFKSDFNYQAMKDDFIGYTLLDESRYIYFLIMFDFFIMFETGIHMLYKTYKPNEIIPFPINLDVINSFKLAIVMPLPTTHFYAYLESLLEYEEALIIFGLHADISMYNKMVEEEEDYEFCKEKAVEIFEDYIIDDCNYQIEQPVMNPSMMYDDDLRDSNINDDSPSKE